MLNREYDQTSKTQSTIDSIYSLIEQIKEFKSKHASMDEVIELISHIRQNKTIIFPLDQIDADKLYSIIMPHHPEWQEQQEFLIRRLIHNHLQNYYTDRLIGSLNCKDENNIHPSLTHAYSANGMIIIYGKHNILKLLSLFENYLTKNYTSTGLAIMANHLPMGLAGLIEPTDQILAKRIEKVRNIIKQHMNDGLIKKFLALLFSKQFRSYGKWPGVTRANSECDYNVKNILEKVIQKPNSY